MAQPDAGVARVGVVGVVPHHETRGGARRARGRPPHAQQRAAPRRVPRGHARERARAGPAAESQQHRLGLVVERVPEQHGGERACRVQRAVASRSGSGLWAARGADVDAKDLRVNASQSNRLLSGGGRHPSRILLQSVVDDQGGRRLQLRGDGRQRKRVRPTRQRDAPPVVVGDVAATEGRHRGAQRAYSTLSIHRCGSSISVGSGSVSGPDQIMLNRAIPTRSTT